MRKSCQFSALDISATSSSSKKMNSFNVNAKSYSCPSKMLVLANGEKHSTVVGNSFRVSLNVLKLVVFFSNFVHTSFTKYMERIIKVKDRIHFRSLKKFDDFFLLDILYKVFTCFPIVNDWKVNNATYEHMEANSVYFSYYLYLTNAL